jgi:hypothetical protein
MHTITFPTRIVSFFAFLCFLSVIRPTASAGLYDELIAGIEMYIASDTCELQPPDRSRSIRPIGILKTEGLPSGQYRKALQTLQIIFFSVSEKPLGCELFHEIAQAAAGAFQDPYDMLEETAKEYFVTQYQAILDSIQFSDKEGKGLQLGRVMTFAKTDDPTGQYRFHIKTHQLGSRSSQFSSAADSAASIDPSEIFTYKFLELSGFGPEVHFFWKNSHDFYIATLNVGGPSINLLPNYSYAQIKKNPTLLLVNPSGPLSESVISGKIPEEITPDQASNVNPVVMQGYIQIYIISQLLGLSDIIKNDGNAYFICGNGNLNELTHVQIIDFAIVDNNTYMPQSPKKFQKIDRITQILFFLSFLNGAGSCRNSEDGIIRYLLVNQSTKDRFLAIKQAIEANNIVARFNESFSGAFQFTQDLIKNKSLPISPTALRDFKRRTDDLSTRAKFLFESITRYSDSSIERLIAKYEGDDDE